MSKIKTRNRFIAFLTVTGILMALGCLNTSKLIKVESVGNNNTILYNNDYMARNIYEIINYGALAPSTHNAQMWKIKMISNHEIIVMLDQSHILPQVDPLNRESMISIGAFIENMVEVAPKYNLEAEIQMLARKPQNEEIARIVFISKTPVSDVNQIVENLINRHTIRTIFLKKALTDQDLKSFSAFDQRLTYFPLKSNEGQYLKEAIIQSIIQQVTNDKKQLEFAEYMRFSKKEAEVKKDGITPEMLGLSGLAKWYVSTFFNQNTVLSKSFREQTVAIVKQQAENCAGFVIITSPDNSVGSLVNAGRTLEKFLIIATGMKIAVQPLSSPLEESPWQEEISQRLGKSQEIQMILRVGYVKNYGNPVSKRRNVLIIQK